MLDITTYLPHIAEISFAFGRRIVGWFAAHYVKMLVRLKIRR